MAAGNLRVSLVINADGTAAIQTINRVRGSVGELDQAAGRAASGGLSAVTSQLKGLALTAGAALGLSNLAASFTAANVAAGTLRAGLETVTGSARAGAAAWAQLQEFAAQTPFSLQQATEGFIKLKAMGLDPSREALLSYANTASAMGKDLSMMIEAVVDASNSSFERLREFGITASQQGDKVSLTFQGMTTTIGNNAAEIESYLRRIGEVQFAGAIERQSETLGVALSNVGDAWDQLMVEIGDSGLTEALVDGLQEVTGWLAELKGEVADGLGGEINATVAETVALFGGWTEAIAGVMPALAGVVQALAELPNYNLVIRDGALALQEQGTAWEALVDLVGFAAQSFLDLPDNLRAAVGIILGEIDILKTTFQAGMDQLPLIAQQAWAAIQNAIVSAIGAIKIAVAEMVAYVAGQLASLASNMANVMAQVPEVLDIGGIAVSAAAGLNDLANGLNSAEDAVVSLKNEHSALGQQYQQDTAALTAQQQAITDRAESEIAAIRGVILAGIEEAQANKARRVAQAELNAEFARAEAGQASLERQSLKTGQAISGAGKAASGAVKPTNDMAKAKGGASKASKELASAQKAESQALQAALRTVEGLVRTYLPAKAAAQDYAEALAALATAGTAAGLSQEELAAIMAGMARDQANIADEARRAADGFYNAWADAVDSLDDTFQGLWRGLLTGQDDVLGNLKETVLEWIADLSYQLLLSPIVVPIQGALLGMAGGGMGLPGGAGGMVGGAANVASGIGGMSNMFSGLSSGFNLLTGMFSGSTYAGITSGFGLAMQNISTAGYFGAFGTNMSLVGSSAGSGAMGTAIGAALPYLVPAAIAIAGIGAIVSKWQKDQEPRYGTIVGMTGGSVAGLEDWENGPANYSRGAFGLTFGISDKGSKNMKASELKKTYDALAEVTDVLAKFFGDDLTGFITEELKKMSTFGDGLIHLTENEGDLGAAMAMLVEHIATAAGRSSEDIGIAFGAMVGDLKGSAEKVGEQIQGAMQAAIMAMQLSENHAERVGQMLGLTGAIATDAARLSGLIDTFGTASETSAETLTRLVTQLGILDQAATNTATNLEGMTTEAMIRLSDSLVDAFGGLDAAAQASAFYYDQFTTATAKLVDVVEAAGRKVTTGLADLVSDLATSLSEADMAVLSAQLNSPLLDTRAGFEALIGSLDLTTEAGQKLYAGLLKLAPAFDLLYDGVEAFEDWLLGTDKVEQATRDLEKVFADWGMSLPTTREALEELYRSGVLSAEQMAILAAYLNELRAVYGDVPTPEAPGAGNLTERLNAAYAVLEKAVNVEKEIINKAYEARRTALEAERDQVNAAYDARMSAISSEREALSAAHDAAMDAFSQQRDAAQEALSAASSALSSVQSAISKLRGEDEVTALDRARALRQIQGWTASGQLPDQDQLGAALNTASTLDANDFATEQAYRLEKIRTLGTLDALEKLAQQQKTDAEMMIEAIEAASAAETSAYEAQLRALDSEAEAAAAWRDAELARIDQQMEDLEQWRDAQISALDTTLEAARTQIEIANGTYVETLSMAEALDQVNKLLEEGKLNPIDAPIYTLEPSTELMEPLLRTATASTAAATSAQATAAETTALKAEIIALRNDLAAANTANVVALKSMDDRLRKWDLDGLPPGRDDVDIILPRAA